MTLATVDGGNGLPVEPEWHLLFTDETDIALAREEWGIVTREMREMTTIAVANGHAVKRLVMFRVQYERAARHVAEHGAMMSAKRAGVLKANPYWTILRQADEGIRILEAELGIAPVRRGKATKLQRKARAPRASDNYLKPVAR